ncbi:UDP-N-acetylglucosamine--N-acetylmuramyl-(pentapeptide) pyrophosphoryl-undecaprenol N-acetylglucosamine transferase [Lysinibacter sp. HNR]|uniref:UDP-N-acetylglucosamine--N-acetylmuramyl- (pentapeptide) pyrophosphoryl-undecaprenol N-acetylglucosamine transferase n=1 Tax=Lysinibacter sp. HNR TaxID=3031408 RepID=UPI00243572CB|nr:UDP-N-acetylglucosamine--N-acetylmuramyl-(pentapeptide) pyrophosphoryl-undecaprenol N-acetylglucosamine transferase [Lysinibacter sp. HNR]WGD36469.1 UDP-N-acetylglucosamine--N-acetylmuramyl-(pentapeptide) pyrophosphoryl-undecaprenol N-acetylglucosamine transferase [Lysinibacter sp. HNR]
MTTYLLAGGGTAGHVNPLLAVADEIRETEPRAQIVILGTTEGLESRLVPARGYDLLTIPRVPFPRRPNRAALTFVPKYLSAVRQVAGIINRHSVDVVVGFGGYVSAPVYRAAQKTSTPFVIHEANAKPGLANVVGARRTKFVGVAFEGTPLPHSRFVGMPLRKEIAALRTETAGSEAHAHFGLDPSRKTLLVTGGSQGARQINNGIAGAAQKIVDHGFQILHVWGERTEIADPGIDHYSIIAYSDRMDLALSVADAAVSRAGSATVSELTGLGIPTVYVPYPVGNGEQRYNVAGLVAVGGAMLVDDANFTPEWVENNLVPLLGDVSKLNSMAERAAQHGVLDGTQRTLALIHEAIGLS